MKTLKFNEPHWLAQLDAMYIASDEHPTIVGEICRMIVAGVYRTLIWC